MHPIAGRIQKQMDFSGLQWFFFSPLRNVSHSPAPSSGNKCEKSVNRVDCEKVTIAVAKRKRTGSGIRNLGWWA